MGTFLSNLCTVAKGRRSSRVDAEAAAA